MILFNQNKAKNVIQGPCCYTLLTYSNDYSVV